MRPWQHAGAASPAGVPVRVLVGITLFLGLCVLPLMHLLATGSAFGRLEDGGSEAGDETGEAWIASGSGNGGGGGGGGSGSHRAPFFRRSGATGKIVPVVGPHEDGAEAEVEAPRPVNYIGAEGAAPAPEAPPPPPPPRPSASASPPAAWRKEDREFVVSIEGTWFGGQHHWANGKRTCPSGCRVSLVHDAPTERADVFLFHGDPRDLGTWVHRRDSLSQSPDTAHKLRLFYAAENFPSTTNANSLVNFHGEASYRLRSIAREVQYPLEAVARFERVGVEVLGEAVTEAGAPHPAYMQRCWNDVAPTIVPWASRTALPDATISWASNHCSSSSGREGYVRELLRHVPVEVYTAPCLANAPSDRTRLSWAEQWALWRSYKFYLAFENTRCDDYVTEKFYLALVRGQVPIVLGAPNIADHAPARDSYIDVRDFATPAALAAHLRFLDTNREAYEAYHAWRTRPFETYGAAFRDVLRGALPIAQRDGPKTGHASGNMFACSVCTDLAAWDTAGRPTESHVPPFTCEPAIGPAANDGKWVR